MSDDASQLPEIAISRTSTESRASQSSSKRSGKQPVQRPPSPHGINTKNLRNDHHWYRNQGQGPWKQYRGRTSPDLPWHIKWNKDCFSNGRVLIIDYVSNETEHNLEAPRGKRHIAVAAQEFEDIKGLKGFYSDSKRVHSAALRVIHVQNATWATKFLLAKFNIDHPSELVGMQGFSRWARYERPRQRNGKPFPNGRSFRAQTDPWRNISRTAFGLDYLKCYQTPAPHERRRPGHFFGGGPIDAQMMHLNAYEDGRNPYGYDASVQRLSVYIQRNLGPPRRISPADDVKNPYAKPTPDEHFEMTDEDGRVYLSQLDNSNTVIVFETSASMLLQDCLAQPRNDFEKRWRRLSFYLRKEEALNDARLAAQCTNLILGDLFHGLAIVWDEFLSFAADHVNILEDKIYENPADESRAPELWTNQAAWLKVDKIMWIHQDLVRETQGHLRELAEVETSEDEVSPLPTIEWITSTPAEYEKLSHSVQEDLVQPTANLSDLMYKSVGIRDSRQSLQLSLSMWRLSWITFIFLPLTFIVGFFGMNVDIFQTDPNVGWYFLAAAMLMLLVLILWYCVKHSLQRRRQTPYQRGVYEHLFNEMEVEHPLLWSHTNGATEDIQPTGFVNKIRWRLLKHWFAPDKTIDKKLYSSLADSESADLGSWAKFKRYLLRRWLPEIQNDEAIKAQDAIDLAEIGSNRPSFHSMRYDTATIQELAKMSTPVVIADAEPSAVQKISAYGLRPLSLQERRSSAGSPRHSEERPSSRGSSGIMIEERNLSDSESDAGEGPAQDLKPPYAERM
ncbi:Hypothetical protein R9X50_00291600 [Acrodontium crateriforme]|uniref:Uncharacterized protein n=1 Tax=Acrodontium crateriforme TaxID=150365 RepID=A0AAQ3M2E5_9PEZI|nr:Hypothetical protein R9X50_00291600 [Acrodontium crateriforme]